MMQRVLMIVLIVVVVLGGGYYAYQQLVPPPQEETQGPVYATKPVVRGDIQVGVEVTGTLNPSRGGSLRTPGSYDHRMNTSYNFNFIIDEILAEEGDEVKKGQVVMRLISPELETKIETLEDQLEADKEALADKMNVSVDRLNTVNPARGINLTAPISGRVMGLNVKEGQELQAGDIIARIVNDSRFRLVAKLSKAEFQHVEVGQRVALRFSTYNGFVEGKVVEINPDPVPEPVSALRGDSSVGSSEEEQYQFVHWVTIEADNPGLIRPGMEVNVGLVDKSYTGEIKQTMDFGKIRWIGYPSKVENYVDEEKVLSTAEAIATEVHVKEMQQVKKGEPLVSLSGEDAREQIEAELEEIREKEEDLRQLRSLFDQMEIESPIDGVVANIRGEVGESVPMGDWLGHIYNTGDMRMGVRVDDVDVLLIRQDAPVEITLDAVPGKTFEGKVEHVSTMGEDRDGVTRFYVDISVKGGPELRPGMQAKGYINAGSAENVLLVPLEAIFEEDGKPKVEVLQEDGSVKVVPVKLGLMNDRVAEVKSGLQEGDQVVVGSSADILPSQRIQSQDSLLPDTPDDGGGEDNGSGSE